jgi:predicted nucleic acid-binding protein
MRHPKAPLEVREWISSPPLWVNIQTPRNLYRPALRSLGKGELAAIAIALEESADAVLMDDRAAINEGRRNDLTVLTTFTVLELAAMAKLIDFEEVLNELMKTTFRMPPDDIVNEYLIRNSDRKLTVIAYFRCYRHRGSTGNLVTYFELSKPDLVLSI